MSLDHIEHEVVGLAVRLDALERDRQRQRASSVEDTVANLRREVDALRDIAKRQSEIISRCWQAIEDLSL